MPALLDAAATRADLIARLAGERGASREQLRDQPAEFTASVLGARTGQGAA